MSAWPGVTWTEAGQLLDLMSDTIDRHEFAADAGLAPDAFFTGLIAKGRIREAVNFLAHALPRYESVVWAVQVLLETGTIDRTHPIMNAALRWVDDPNDALRREIKRLADAEGDITPARLLGVAIFVSGGSVSEPNLPPVLPAPDASAKLIHGALLKAVKASPDPKSMMMRAVDAGKAMASQGYNG